MTEVIVAPQARADILRIVSYLAEVASGATAVRWNERLWATIDSIGHFPGAGAPRPKLGRFTRIAIVKPYIVIYDHALGSEVAYVLRVVHGRRRITRRLLKSGAQ